MRGRSDQSETIAASKAVSESSTVRTDAAPDSIAPRLAEIWQKFLGVKTVRLDENYFDLGGDSSLAVQIFAEIEKIFGVKLPLATLYEAQTVEELARILREQVPSSGWSELVAIQANGTRPPLFCMHPHGGNVLIYRDLSRHLGSDQPFYGLQSQGLDGAKSPLKQIEDMAALYVKQIQTVQPHGPYYLGGYCMGGLIAYEVALQFQAEGEPVALLAMFDAIDFSKVNLPTFSQTLYYNGERLLYHMSNFLLLDHEGRAKFFHEKTRTLQHRARVFASKLFEGRGREPVSSEPFILGKIWQANFDACLRYFPRPYPGTVTDFRPATQYRMYDKPNVKWDQLALGGQEVVVLPVNPPAMLIEPFVAHLAVALRQAMDDAIRGCDSRSRTEPVANVCGNGRVD